MTESAATAAGRRRPVRPTLEMVATRAGVSRGTASRALTGGVNVSARAMAAVGRAAQELGYHPNLAARSLVLGRSDSVGLLVSETDERLFGDPFFGEVVRGVHTALADRGVQLMLALAQSEQERRRFVRFAPGRLDGVLLISMHGDDSLPDSLEQLGVPVVLAGRPDSSADSTADRGQGRWWVDADNRGGARLAAEHLLRTGRRTLATITGPQDMGVGVDRLAGFLEPLAAAGMADPPAEAGDFSEGSGYEAMSRLLQRQPDLDGVFAASDLMAIGAIRRLADAGRRVPDQVGVVGFDDIPLAAGNRPALTTVRQPVAELGRQLVDLLLRRISDQPGEVTQLVLPTELVIRRSS